MSTPSQGSAGNARSAAAMVPSWLADFVLLAAIWGSSFLFTRLASVELGALATAAGRSTVASLFLLPILWQRGLAAQLRQHWKPIFLIGIFNSAIPFVCFAFALLSISTGLSAILNATTPLFGALVAWLWLKDRLTRLRVIGLVIGFAGVALLVWDKASFKAQAGGVAAGWAVLVCLLATLCYGTAASMTKRYLAGLPALVTASGSQLGASLSLIPLALWQQPAHLPSLRAWLALLALGVVCTGIAYVRYFRLIEKAGPSRTVAVTFVIPLFAVFYGALLLGEKVTGQMLLCGVIIICGTALSTGLIKFSRKSTSPSAT